MRWPRRAACVLLAGGLLVGVCLPAAGAEDDSSYGATRVSAAIRLDGDLSDKAWRNARVISEFVQREPSEGAPPTFRTEARVLYDAAAIYVGVRAFDSEPDRILAFLARRDTDSASGWYLSRLTPAGVTMNSWAVRRSWYESMRTRICCLGARAATCPRLASCRG